MKMLVVLALAAVACAEPEADAQLLTYNTSPLLSAFNTYTHSVATPLVKAAVPAVTYKAAVPAVTYKAAVPAVTYKAAAPAVTYKAAVTYNTVPTPAVYNAAVSPVVYAQPQVATHTITNYNNPEHYTAVSNGVFGPKYIAKNGAVQHVVKREAEAEAEADADALLYNTLPLAYNTAVNTVAAPAVTYSHAVAAPAVTYSHAVAAPAVTYKAVAPAVTYKTVPTPAVTYKTVTPAVYNSAVSPLVYNYNGAVHHLGKREAEADAEALHYSALPYTYNTAVNTLPVTYNTVAAPAVTYTNAVNPAVYSAVNHVVAAPSLYKAAPHAVAFTPQGVTHSANVGICTNNVGAVVPC